MPRGITPRQPSRSGRPGQGFQHRQERERADFQVLFVENPLDEKPVEWLTCIFEDPPKQNRLDWGTLQSFAEGHQGLQPAGARARAGHPRSSRCALSGRTCALHHNSAWELLVATILSAQCTDERVNMVTPSLFEKYPTPTRFRRPASPRTSSAGHPLHRLLPQQGEVDGRRRAQGRRRIRRRSAAHHGRVAHHPRRRAQDRQRGARHRGTESPTAWWSIRTCSASRGGWN